MSLDKIGQIRGKLTSAQILMEQIRNDHAAEATLLPTGDLATSADDAKKLLSLHKMDMMNIFIKMIETVKDNI